MTVDVTKTQFASAYNIDKIQTWATTTDSSGAGLEFDLSVIIAANTTLPALEVTAGSLNNPYGKKGLINISWSLDKLNYYPLGGQIVYYNNTYKQWVVQMLVFGAVSDSTIYFAFGTQYDVSAQRVYFQFAVSNPS